MQRGIDALGKTPLGLPLGGWEALRYNLPLEWMRLRPFDLLPFGRTASDHGYGSVLDSGILRLFVYRPTCFSHTALLAVSLGLGIL